MKALAEREEQAWREVGRMLNQGCRIASVYDDATARLKKLEQLADSRYGAYFPKESWGNGGEISQPSCADPAVEEPRLGVRLACQIKKI